MSTNVDTDSFGKNWTDKLRLLDAIDAMRGPAEPPAAAKDVLQQQSDTVEALQEKLRVYEQTCSMLEQEVQTLEQQTMTALAEAGRLRRELDKSQNGQNASSYVAHAEKERFDVIIRESENERRLLLDALENSEAELARMVKALDLVVRKFQVA